MSFAKRRQPRGLRRWSAATTSWSRLRSAFAAMFVFSSDGDAGEDYERVPIDDYNEGEQDGGDGQTAPLLHTADDNGEYERGDDLRARFAVVFCFVARVCSLAICGPRRIVSLEFRLAFPLFKRGARKAAARNAGGACSISRTLKTSTRVFQTRAALVPTKTSICKLNDVNDDFCLLFYLCAGPDKFSQHHFLSATPSLVFKRVGAIFAAENFSGKSRGFTRILSTNFGARSPIAVLFGARFASARTFYCGFLATLIPPLPLASSVKFCHSSNLILSGLISVFLSILCDASNRNLLLSLQHQNTFLLLC